MTAIMQMVMNTNITSNTGFITSGALLYVDAGNSSSYSGSGTAWNDLSTNTNNYTLVNSPPFTSAGTSSYFTFNGIGNQYAACNSNAKFNQTYTGKTVFFAARITNATFNVGTFRCVFGTNSGSRNFNTYLYMPSAGVLQYHYSAGGGGGFSNNLSLAYNQWFVGAVTQTTGGLVSYYYNGQPVGTNTGITFAQYSSNGGEFIALGDNYWYGDIGLCAVYGQALTSNQILQNYNALKGRYGL